MANGGKSFVVSVLNSQKHNQFIIIYAKRGEGAGTNKFIIFDTCFIYRYIHRYYFQAVCIARHRKHLTDIIFINETMFKYYFINYYGTGKKPLSPAFISFQCKFCMQMNCINSEKICV